MSALSLSAMGAEPAATHARYFRPPSAAVQPALGAGEISVVNAASFLHGISPGGLVTIFGQNLTDITGVVYGNTDPLPKVLADVSVLINGRYAPIYAIAYANGQDQISVQVPYDTPVGPKAARVEVLDYGSTVGSALVDSYDQDPGIFVYQGDYAVALRYPDYSLIGPDNRAARGDVLILYTTGLGPLSLILQDGYGAPGSPPATTMDPFQVLVAGRPCRVLFSGLGPGYVGLYQINLQLPSDLPAGDLDIQILSQYSNSQIATLPVR